MSKLLKNTTSKELKKNMTVMSYQVERINKMTEIIKLISSGSTPTYTQLES
jgi:hypothetical protein